MNEGIATMPLTSWKRNMFFCMHGKKDYYVWLLKKNMWLFLYSFLKRTSTYMHINDSYFAKFLERNMCTSAQNNS